MSRIRLDTRNHLMALRRQVQVVLLCLCWSGSVLGDESENPSPQPVATNLISNSPAFPGDTWRFFSGRRNARLAETWRLAVEAESSPPILVCTGEPHGYLQTTQSYENYDLEVEWRYPRDPNGNSGILLHINGDPRLWPASVQVQLYQPEAGSTFPHAGMLTENHLKKVPQLAKPVSHWNRCQISSRSGTVSVIVNGQKVGEVTGCRPRRGPIGLQSEGSEVHFRNLIIRELPTEMASQQCTSDAPTLNGVTSSAPNIIASPNVVPAQQPQ